MAPAMMHSPAAAPVHGLAATAGDYEVVRQIEKTHLPNGEEIDAMYILNIAKDILDECKNNIPPTQISEEEGGDNTKLTPELQFEVNRLSIQLSHRSLEGGDDVHKKTITLLNMLSSYSWEVKVALILAAYVSNYGEYWLLAQTYRDQDPIAMNMVALLQMSNLLKDDNNQLETLFQPLENLVNSVLDLCGCIVEVKEFLSSGYASSNPAEFARFRAIIIICSYWIIRCCVICTSYMHSLIVKDPSRTTAMDEVLKTLAGKIEPLHNHLQKQLLICYQNLDAKDKIEALGRVLRTNHIDNMNVLKLLFDAMDDKPTPIFDVSNKKSVSLETMKNKTVLLLISNTDLELPFLQEWHEKCNQAQRNQHEIIFIPITESPVDTKKKTLTMPFYIVDDPRSIDPTVIRFVKEKLSFQEEPILVALGTQGRIVHPNAMPMVWTWGPKAFPLTTENEESLRKSETWKLEMLINDLDDTLIKMAQEGKSICLYGGDNLEWIRMFAAKAKEVANSLSVPLEMFFLGKSTDNLPKLKKIMSNIYSEKLVSTIPELDSTKVRSLWAHLERILLSRAQYLKRTKQNSVAEDGVLQGWEKLLDKSGRRGWALFSKGNDIALIGDEDVTMTALNEIDKWKGNVKQNGFEGALKDYYEMLQGGPSDRPCCRLHFQDGRSDEILESLTCPECHRRLNKYTAFLCNHINGGDKKKLEFFEGGRYSFDLEDLLKASAEVLGKGSVGTSYKATLEEGTTTVVVKRLRDVTVSRKEFQQQMKVLGKLKNENVFPLRAFYFSEDEKMLVSDYMPAGSLSTLLHGAGSPIDWVTRKEIALCAAKGLAYLHERGNIVHGNIKASNILLKQDDNHEACLSDYGLNPLFSNSTPLNHGYCAPEVLETRKVTFKSDVYSYGVLLLELLTRKSPNQTSLGDEGIDLPRWVQSVVREEWTPEVFDVELMRDHNVEEDLVQVLQIGMYCVAMVPDHRPTMADVVRMMEEISFSKSGV